jgi:hypothetical protein
VIVVRRSIQGRFMTMAVGVGTAVAALATVLTAAGGAVAADTHYAASTGPLFVNTDALPQGPRFGSWHGGAAIDGLPAKAPFCLSGEFAAKATKYRPYSAAPKVAGQEYISTQGTVAAADALVSKLGRDLQECYRQWLSLNIPAYHDHKRSASWERYTSSTSAGVLTVYGVYTVPPKGFDPATHLFAVGRQGNTVMLLHISLVGTRSNAPVSEFTKSANTALQVMFP